MCQQCFRRHATLCWPKSRTGVAGITHEGVEVHKVFRAGWATEDAKAVPALVALQREEVVDGFAHVNEAPDNLRLGVGDGGRAVVDIDHCV